MATKYIQATNTGQGFITHSDQEVDHLSFAGAPADVWTVTGTTSAINAWSSRVSGTTLTKTAAQTVIDASLVGVTDPITGNAVTFAL